MKLLSFEYIRKEKILMLHLILSYAKKLLGENGSKMHLNMLNQDNVALETFMRSYVAQAGSYDELISAEGQVRPKWHTFLDHYSKISQEEQKDLSEKLRRLVYENGLAHDVYSDPDSTTHSWNLDQLPIIIAPEDWEELTKAIRQRARLFNEILKDLYGSQQLLKEGKIPARLVFSDSSFLKPLVSEKIETAPLYFFAVDVSRNNDGSWRIIDCHTESPAGLGYAIANRVVHTKVLGETFEACNIQREANFFQNILNEIPDFIGESSPRVVILSHGLQHGDYFSHAYLSRYLGYRIVEGSDLQVVDGKVFLKTLSGPMLVDGIIRSIDGELSDPLELNPNGFLGPSGFVQAVRKNPRLSLNVLGSGILENRGLGALLPGLCQDLLGEELEIYDTIRLWMGDKTARSEVIGNLEDYLLHPLREKTGRPGEAQTGRRLKDLTEDEQQNVLNDLKLRGDQFVAEKPSNFATTPSWTDKGFAPVPYAMRLFAAFDGEDYQVLPGGLAMSVDPKSAVALNSREGQVRDVWIPSTGTEEPYKTLIVPRFSPKEIDRDNALLPSRVADNLFWLGRYTERAEWTMRLMRSVLIQAEEERGLPPDVDAIRKTLEILIMKEGSNIELPSEGQGVKQIDNLVRILRSSNAGTFGLKGTLERILYVAQLIRDRLSLESWQALNSFKKNPWWWEDVVSLRTDDSIDLLNEGIRTLAAFSGIVTENMTRNYAWRFLEIGRRLERAHNHCEVLHTLFSQQANEQAEASRLFFMLKLADSLITYRSRYRFAPDMALVMDLLIIDESNPRGLCFQLQKISDHINALPKSSDDAVRTEEQKMILELNTKAKLANISELVQANNEGVRETLKRLLEDQIESLPILSEILSRRYFNLIDNSPVRVHTP